MISKIALSKSALAAVIAMLLPVLSSIIYILPFPFGGAEILPYYLLSVIAQMTLIKFQFVRLISLSALFTVFFVGYSFLGVGADVYLDMLQIYVVFTTLICVQSFSIEQRKIVSRTALSLLYVFAVIMIFQKLNPSGIDFVYNRLVQRSGSSSHIMSYTGGVIGIGPEPAYMAALCLALGLIALSSAGMPAVRVFFFTGICIVLTQSLSVFMIFIINMILYLGLSRKQVLFILSLILGLFFSAWFFNMSLIERVHRFLFLIDFSTGFDFFLAIDRAFGSFRLRPVYDFLSFSDWDFSVVTVSQKGSSIFSELFYKVGYLSHGLLIYFLFRSGHKRLKFTAIVNAIFLGPILNWGLYVGLAGERRE